jgi:hypothetical protein
VRRTAPALVALLLLSLLGVAPVGADTLEPSQWPAGIAYGSAANALRIGGDDRYLTSEALALTLRGTGDLPFSSPDRTTGDWWGAATCPRSVIIVAGDTPADSLAAASLSDPTDRSNEPRLVRVASSDPGFDPIGGIDRVDTGGAPLLVTASGRSGAIGLTAATRAAIADLVDGGCRTVREAILVGGQAAVPVEVEGELISMGLDEVFRVAGPDRAGTAAAIAVALGTEPAPAGGTCVDPDVTDGSATMGFYGNAVIEFRRTRTRCELLGRAVVLADGGTGADAMAAGWWTSRWQVPVLLTNADGSLPPATVDALQHLAIDTIVVLGGTGRIPESVVDEAKLLAGAVAGRFAGADRYETSVVMAASLGGWYPTGDGADFGGDVACLVGSSGTGDASRGWPDALGSGPLCARLSAVDARGPDRALPPIERPRSQPVDVDGTKPAHDAVPVLLVRPGAALLPDSVHTLLEGAFGEARWCNGRRAAACVVPGFAVAIGGAASVSDLQLHAASTLVGGGEVEGNDTAPAMARPFVTDLDLAPVYDDAGDQAERRVCVSRGDLTDVRWLAVYRDAALTQAANVVDVAAAEVYLDDAGVQVESEPVCVAAPSDTAELGIVGVSASGNAVVATGPVDDGHRLTMSGAMQHSPAVATSGDAVGDDEGPGTTALSWVDVPPPPGIEVRHAGPTASLQQAAVNLTLRRTATGQDRFIGTIDLDTSNEHLQLRVGGEAVATGVGWALSGRASDPGNLGGGFRGTIVLDDAGGPPRLVWRADLAGV